MRATHIDNRLTYVYTQDTLNGTRMATQIIGIRDFRAHVAQYAKAAREKDQRFIVTNNKEPLFEVVPIDQKEFAIALLEAEIAERRDQARQGKVISQEELMKKYGIL